MQIAIEKNIVNNQEDTFKSCLSDHLLTIGEMVTHKTLTLAFLGSNPRSSTIGLSYNGSTIVSKTMNVSSILSGPAMIFYLKIFRR